MKITEVRCILFGEQPLLRVMTDAHIDGYSQIESNQKFVVPVVEYLADFIIGLDPTNVEKVMLQIRRRGSFKPWGSAASALEIALWDIAGKAAGLPVYKLLGGKVRDRVRVYNGGVQFELKGYEPEHYAEVMTQMKDSPEGFTVIKYPLGFHGPMFHDRQDYYFSARRGGPRYLGRGKATSDGIDHVVDCVAAMREALGTTIELALDLGPGWMLSDAIVLAQALEPYRLAWLEDMLTGDTMPYVDAEAYRTLTNSTASPIHTGEQLYLRNNFMELISKRAVRVVGPDPCDVGGIAELKWIAEYADLHGIMIAPHGVFDGVLGLAAQIQVGATMPDNYIAFEYPVARPSWWYSIVEGLPDSIVNDGMIEVLERPGLGVRIIPEMARRYLDPGESGFFD